MDVRDESRKIRQEVRKQTIGYILAALGLVAGLAWNEAIRALIDKFFPASGSSLLAKFIYAVLITLVVVIVSIYLVRLTAERESTDQQERK